MRSYLLWAENQRHAQALWAVDHPWLALLLLLLGVGVIVAAIGLQLILEERR